MRVAGRHAGILTAAVVVACALAAPAQAARGQTLTLTTRLSTFYDDNYLQYSDGQLSDFESGRHPARFGIETTDDAIFNPSLGLLWELDQGHGRRHAARLRGEGDFHGRNGTADFRSLSAGWREDFNRDRRLQLGYYLLPHYYLRQLFDEDWTAAPASVRYRRAQFGLQIASVGWDQRLTRGTSLGADYQYERRHYAPPFDVRTSGLHQGAIRTDWTRLPHQGSVELRGGYRFSHSDSTDGDDAAGQPSDDVDVSYRGIVAGSSGRVEFWRRGAWRLGGDLAWDLETRHYLSKVRTDKYHVGRRDVLNAVEVGVRTACRPHWSWRTFYRHEQNTARLGSAAPLSTDAGSYKVNQVGLAIEWTGELWSGSEARGTDERED